MGSAAEPSVLRPPILESLRGESQPPLTVIIPVFNEVRTIEKVLRRVIAAPYEKQIIIVDDGSNDGTPSLLEKLATNADLLVLHHSKNQGKGAAVRTALSLANGRVTIIQDGDLELDPVDYPLLIEPILAGEAEFVIGSRFLISSRWSFSRLGVSVLNAIVRTLYGIKLTDEACGYKAARTETLRAMDLQCERFEFCPEVVAKACRMELQLHEVPVTYRPRRASEGKKLRYRDGLQAVATLWKWRRWEPEGQESGVRSRASGVGSQRVRGSEK